MNIQDGAVLHGTFSKSETKIDEGASIGHNATVHGAHVQAGALIGMNAVVLDGAVIGAKRSSQPEPSCLKERSCRHEPFGPACQQSNEEGRLSWEHLASTADRYVEYACWFNR